MTAAPLPDRALPSRAPLAYRIGYGEDAHRLARPEDGGRSLVLGGVHVPSERGAVAHSDGDAVLHALADALLSGLALGDIGQYFPDTAAEWQGMDSRGILARALELARGRGYAPVNVALVVTLDRPKLGPLRAEIARSIAGLLALPESEVGVSFKTSEGLAPDHVQTRVTVLLGRLEPERTDA
jgi:2-C-methyl-D-erythritol 2,4-cyclodiphosphate synthase